MDTGGATPLKVLPGVGLASSLSTQSGRDCRLTLAWRSPQFPREVLAAAGTESAAFPWGAPSPRGQPHAPRLEAAGRKQVPVGQPAS